jgi:histidine ammonia-lyase
MAAHGARRLSRMTANLQTILGVELLCAVQGIELRAPLTTSPPLARVVERLRRDVPHLQDDRLLAPELGIAARMIASGEAVAASDIAMPALRP